jgi:hypothetical protein
MFAAWLEEYLAGPARAVEQVYPLLQKYWLPLVLAAVALYLIVDALRYAAIPTIDVPLTEGEERIMRGGERERRASVCVSSCPTASGDPLLRAPAERESCPASERPHWRLRRLRQLTLHSPPAPLHQTKPQPDRRSGRRPPRRRPSLLPTGTHKVPARPPHPCALLRPRDHGLARHRHRPRRLPQRRRA